jgi:alpha-glucosidase (family GH31 glycosyl hydrolase)|tara:strand:- start:2500 stop:2661 length:162 start_codon:yes stop_codon:yes gene_type:complete
MKDFADFSVDTATFPNLATWTETLHANNQKLTLIIDAALAAENIENPYYAMAN